MATIRGWAAMAANQPLEPYEYDPGPLGAEDVEVAVEHCGICHSDLSVINNDWGNSKFPFVPGHEAVGRVSAVGEHAKRVKVGERVGVGWTASSCMHCRWCLSGEQQLCRRAVATIIGHQGAFAERVRAHWAWAIPLPDDLDATSAGPLLCGGITVFDPLARFARPMDRVGVVGIGGLGHLGVKFAAAMGCEVTAFTSHESKFAEARGFGAHQVLSSRDSAAVKARKGALDLLLVTVNVPLDWAAMIATLAPKGRMHVVGAVPEPIPVAAFDLIGDLRSVSGSPTGAPVAIERMLEFAARNHVAPQVEHFPMSRVNDALAHLAAGKARYRIVLDAESA
jgi:uncharacterized zinc-type alcohol dehydrogenase-like protein